MKRIINTLLLSALTASAATFGSCNDWTDAESLGLKYPSFEEQNPELYKQYLQSLCDYKQTQHPVLIFTMPGSAKAPGQRNEHFITVPDSVDFICLTNQVELHPVLVAEMKQVRRKGTQLLYTISYDELEARWDKLPEAESGKPSALEADGTSEETPEMRFLAFCKEQTELQLSYFDRYDFDGIVFTYSGRNTDGMTPAEMALYTARQRSFFDCADAWRMVNRSKTVLFEGAPQNLVDKSLLSDCAYIILPALSATSADKLSLIALSALAKDVPSDRFVIGVMAPSATNAADERGYFNSFDADGKTPLRAVKGAARWVVLPTADYTKAGISVANAQDDYFDITLAYKNIREAIATMNPSPKN